MVLYNASMCFVCAHFAAGQSQIFERNADYHEITKKLSFPLGRTLDSHDYVFWCGDFNYRIDMPNDEVKKLVKAENWSALLAADQLLSSKEGNQVFKDFFEGQINFAPTYKYDIFSDDFDTSEKCRIPSWTDRVLFRKKKYNLEDYEEPGTIAFYGRAELKTSDHRPVIALIDIDVLHIDGPKRLQVFQSLVESGPPDGTVIIQILNECAHLEDNVLNNILNKICNGKSYPARFVNREIYLTFPEGIMAVQALEYNNVEMDGYLLKVQLKTPDWSNTICKTLQICRNNTSPLISSVAKSSVTDIPFSELACIEESSPTHHIAVSELSKEVLKSLDHKTDWPGALEGYTDSDYEPTKSQPSSGRSSPVIESSGQKFGSPSKLPPRPPPPVKSVAPPRRPPPPQKMQLQGPKSDSNSNILTGVSAVDTQDSKSSDLMSFPPEDNTSLRSEKDTSSGQNASYVSCPPPSAPPPPPPPNLEKSSSTSQSSTGKSSKNNSASTGKPVSIGRPAEIPIENTTAAPPIPSRSSHSSVPAANKPPPIPARPPTSQINVAGPRKPVQ